MARVYSVSAANGSVTNAVNLPIVFVNPGTTCSLGFCRAWASQSANATSAQQTIAIKTQVTAFPTLTSTAPSKLNLLDPVSQITGGTAGAAGTSGTFASAAGAGTQTNVFADAFNVLNGYLWVPTPQEIIVMNAGAASGLGLYFPTAPTSTGNWNGGLNFAEM